MISTWIADFLDYFALFHISLFIWFKKHLFRLWLNTAACWSNISNMIFFVYCRDPLRGWTQLLKEKQERIVSRANPVYRGADTARLRMEG